MNNKKYSKKTILDYVSGNDLEGFSIEELEDNPSFMADVMEFTGDKRMYHLCSENVKKNHDFVIRVISKFKDDMDFITQIADSYVIDNDDNGFKQAEFNILMGNIFDETKEPDLMKYKLSETVLYDSISVEIEDAINEVDEKDRKLFGKGFCFVRDTFPGSKLIKDFFAKRMLDEILFADEKYRFEEIVHINFKKYEDLEKYGVTKFILEYVGARDSDLSDYLCQNQELISSVKNKLVRVKKGWENYINRINKEKIEMIWEEVYRYQDQRLIYCGLNYVECLDKIMSKLGVLDLLGITSMRETLDEDFDVESEITSICGEEGLEEFIQATCPEIEKSRFELHMTSFIRDLFKTNVIEEQTDENDYLNEANQNRKDKSNCKILKLSFHPNKNN